MEVFQWILEITLWTLRSSQSGGDPAMAKFYRFSAGFHFQGPGRFSQMSLWNRLFVKISTASIYQLMGQSIIVIVIDVGLCHSAPIVVILKNSAKTRVPMVKTIYTSKEVYFSSFDPTATDRRQNQFYSNSTNCALDSTNWFWIVIWFYECLNFFSIEFSIYVYHM